MTKAGYGCKFYQVAYDNKVLVVFCVGSGLSGFGQYDNYSDDSFKRRDWVVDYSRGSLAK